MTDYPFDMQLLVDPLNPENVVANGTATIYDATDTAGVTPLTLKDPSGIPLPNPLKSNDFGFTPPFISTSPRVKWTSGTFEGFFYSYDGLRNEAVAAKAAAQDAAAQAAIAATAPTDAAVDVSVDKKLPPAISTALASNPTVVASAANMAQSTAGLVPAWKASTVYTAGQKVIAPNGDVVSAKVNFTSAAAYSATNWNPSTQDGRVGALEALRALPQTDVLSGDDFNNIRTRGKYLVRDNATAAAVLNIPSAGAGVLEVDATVSGLVFQTYRAYGTFAGLYYRQTSALSPSPYPWRAWVRIDQPKSLAYTDLTTGADFDAQRTVGKYRVISSTLAASMANVPGTTKRAGVLTVDAFDSGIAFQTYQEYAGSIWYRATSSVSTSPFPYSAWVDLAAQPDVVPPTSTNNAYVGLANQLRLDDYSDRRGGRKKTGGLGAASFRFDHGLNNFKNLILPKLQAHGIVGSLALCSRQWTNTENTAVTQSEVNGWVAAGTVEIWNHTATHGDASTYAALSDIIVGGLTELRAQLPAAVIDGFVIPGVGGGTNLGGLNSGTTPENFYATDAGRLILENHAVTSGAYPNSAQRVLDGRIRQGMGHFTMDALTSAQIIAQIDSAKANKTGIQFMLHPSLLDTPGYLTSADLETVLAYADAERAAGRLKIYSPYDLLLADSTS